VPVHGRELFGRGCAIGCESMQHFEHVSVAGHTQACRNGSQCTGSSGADGEIRDRDWPELQDRADGKDSTPRRRSLRGQRTRLRRHLLIPSNANCDSARRSSALMASTLARMSFSTSTDISSSVG